MTEPIQMKPHSHPGVKPGTTGRQRSTQRSANPVKKAPPPPPNPALVNPLTSVPEKPPEAQAEEVKPGTLSPEVKSLQITQNSQGAYEKHSDGALTYFNYYFEDIAAYATPADYPKAFARAKFPVKAVGVGVVAATITSGLMVGNALKPAETPQSTQPQDAADRQDATSQSPRPTTIAPEKLETGRSLSSSPAWSSPIKPTPGKPSVTPLKRSQSATNSLITSGSLVSNSQPLKLPPLSVSATTSDPSPATTAVPPATTSAQPSLASEIVARSANLPQPVAPEVAQAAPIPSTTSQPPFAATNSNGVTIPGAGAATPQAAISQPVSQTPPTPPTSLATPGSTTSGNSLAGTTTAFPPGTTASVPAPDNSVSPTGYTAPATSETSNRLTRPTGNSPTAINPAASSPVTGQVAPTQPITAPGDRLLETAPTGFNRLTPTPLTATPNSPSSDGIQNYLNRPQKPATQAQALMPLSSKAAEEAAAKPQIGAFTVRQVNQQDYQKEWLTSNRNPSDPAIAYAFPAYGFIDYQRQVIIVLKEQPGSTPLQSKVSNLPNG